MREINVGEVYQVNVLGKYWFRGEIIQIENGITTLEVPVHYSTTCEKTIIKAPIEELREVEVDLTKK